MSCAMEPTDEMINGNAYVVEIRKPLIGQNCFPMAQQPLLGQGLLVIEASRLQSDTPHSVGILWTSVGTDADTST
jgi:hypothetical protein